ncbi:hypothetical protein RHAB21_04445 [Pseudorhizobium halotolerans]|uniref:Uncharacterized protein n=1 Tax=Pseudorhizobium halotolerans TaxID=1233081 RepID=A0ABM8PWN0_9HYPH|nr:hypothetical protein [Pseudorhizobium halotolerans]CAD7052422.1 hypothetical protein RHAB21_04445 [Pseudorhizobium halotolerans]
MAANRADDHMILACLLGLGTGLLFKPLTLVPIIVAYCAISLTLPLLAADLEAPLLTTLLTNLVLLNLGYLAGALLSRILPRS